jgi:ERCC4-related helicase
MLKGFKPRIYQETIFATAVQKNALVVLPTGLGKTSIALMLGAQRLRQYPTSKVMILAPTKPLVEQHLNTMKKYLDIDEDEIVLFTGTIKPEKRAEMFKQAKVIISTPQGLENDVISNRISLKDVSLIVFDEAHRAVGDYSYVWLAKQYDKIARYPRILGLTASPGSELEKMNEIIENLIIEEIEIRTDEDPDVKPYVQEVDVSWVKVELPEELKKVRNYLQKCFKDILNEISKYGYTPNGITESKTDILKLQGQLQGEIARGNKDFNVLKSLSLAAGAMKVQHAVELAETQGIIPLQKYFDQLESQARTTKVKAVQNLVRDLNFRSAVVVTRGLIDKKIDHPKLGRLLEIVSEKIKVNDDYKLIVFTQYRDSGVKIVEELNDVSGVNAKLFVGQAKKKGSGMTQKEQIAILDEFREGKFNVLVSSSVGEEGLDIPQVDLVVFYEPIPSAIRHIQRRGRTGRLEKGEVIILMTKNTRDEGYRWSAHHKEKRMHRNLLQLKNNINLKERKEVKLTKFFKEDEKVKIYADHREKASGVIKELIDLGAFMQLEALDSCDYVVSGRCGIEFKTQEDFIESLLDGRLLQQVKTMRTSFERPMIIVEGNNDIYSIRNIHPNAIRGALSTIAVDFQIPILFTKTTKDTAAMIAVLAKREQEIGKRDFTLHSNKKVSGLRDVQEYIVSSLPGVGPTLARPLLKEFKSIKNIVNASEEELRKIELIGEKKAKQIYDSLNKEYEF